jgi:hypothetical protein
MVVVLLSHGGQGCLSFECGLGQLIVVQADVTGCERRLQTVRRVRAVVEVGSSLPLANRMLDLFSASISAMNVRKISRAKNSGKRLRAI